jgi:hypothetical protein
MYAEQPQVVYSASCAVSTEGLEGTPVSISGADSYGLPIVSVATDALRIDGVIYRGGKINEAIRIAKDGIIMCKTGAIIAAVGEVEVKSGALITKSTGVAVGKILGTGASGDFLPVFLY